MGYHIEDGEQSFKELPERILVREDGWYGAYRFYGEPWVDYWYVPERTCHDVGDDLVFVCSECEALVKRMNVGKSYVDGDGKRWYATSNEHDFKFCPSCGARIVAGEASVGDTPTSDDACTQQGLVTLEMTFAGREEEGD